MHTKYPSYLSIQQFAEILVIKGNLDIRDKIVSTKKNLFATKQKLFSYYIFFIIIFVIVKYNINSGASVKAE